MKQADTWVVLFSHLFDYEGHWDCKRREQNTEIKNLLID